MSLYSRKPASAERLWSVHDMGPSPIQCQPFRRVPLCPQLEGRANELGGISLGCDAVLWIEQESTLHPIEFRVDCGASFSMMSRWFAEANGLILPRENVECTIPLTTARGLTETLVRPGKLRVWFFADRRGDPFDWPVLFLMDAPSETPALLGLAGVVTTCRWTLDGRPSGNFFPFGSLMLEDIRA